ncbi:MEDS domain-containing protein [Bradyrhizobium sp. McL0616]|uniref:MEDS domain-containing protein n=1 Tax=Bradyrhizobium sp. McL0616 TaxID=3415674 RepID=UPI003CEC868A
MTSRQSSEHRNFRHSEGASGRSDSAAHLSQTIFPAYNKLPQIPADERRGISKVRMSGHAPVGLAGIDELPWGSHLCQFFANGDELRDAIVPYFKAGLENDERCLLVAMAPFGADDARSALRAAVGDLDRRELEKQTRSTTYGHGTTPRVPLTANVWPTACCAAKSRRVTAATTAFGQMAT